MHVHRRCYYSPRRTDKEARLPNARPALRAKGSERHNEQFRDSERAKTAHPQSNLFGARRFEQRLFKQRHADAVIFDSGYACFSICFDPARSARIGRGAAAWLLRTRARKGRR